MRYLALPTTNIQKHSWTVDAGTVAPLGPLHLYTYPVKVNRFRIDEAKAILEWLDCLGPMQLVKKGLQAKLMNQTQVLRDTTCLCLQAYVTGHPLVDKLLHVVLFCEGCPVVKRVS
jgi:hypothetical protein